MRALMICMLHLAVMSRQLESAMKSNDANQIAETTLNMHSMLSTQLGSSSHAVGMITPQDGFQIPFVWLMTCVLHMSVE